MRLCIGPDGLLQEDVVRRVASTLCTEKPRNYLAILHALTDLVRLEVARHTATVTTARPVLDTGKAAWTMWKQASRTGKICLQSSTRISTRKWWRPRPLWRASA